MDIQAQIDEFQRKCKQLEHNKKTFSEESQKLISSQRQTIEKLKQENKNLQDLIDFDSKGPQWAPSAQQQERIDKLQDLTDTYNRKLEVEKRQLELLEKELEVLQAKAEQTRKGIGGVQALQEKQRNEAKAIKVLENRLEIADRRYNEALARNKELREELDGFSKKKAALNQVYQKLEKEVATKKGEVATLTEAIKVAGEAKTTALTEAATLQAAEDREQASFEVEMKELGRCLEADQKLLEAQRKRISKLVEAASQLDVPSLLTSLDESECIEVLTRLEEVCRLGGEELQGSARWKRVMDHCLQLESANFQLFNECNTANEAIGDLQREIRDMQTEIRQLESEGVVGQTKEVIRLTIQKQDAIQRRAEAVREKTDVIERKMRLVRAGVTGVLHALSVIPIPTASSSGLGMPEREDDGPEQPSAALSGTLHGAADSSLMGNLSLLEGRARAVVAVFTNVMGSLSGPIGNPTLTSPRGAVQLATPPFGRVSNSGRGASGGSRESTASTGRGRGRPPSSTLTRAGLADRVPSLASRKEGDDSSSSDGEAVPMTREQLTAHTLAAQNSFKSNS